MKKEVKFLVAALLASLTFVGVCAAQEQTERPFANKLSAIDVNAPIKAIPREYAQPAQERGELVRVDYPVGDGTKYAVVYLPYGYDAAKRYEIAYVMHGGGDNQNMLLGAPGEPGNGFKNAIDNLIEKGEMSPIIIVAPSFYSGDRGDRGMGDAFRGVQEFPKELVEGLMPTVEEKYSTFADSTSPEDLAKSRGHRLFTGFSMGSLQTWLVLTQQMKYFAVFVPLSGDYWIGGANPRGASPNDKADAIAKAIEEQGFGADDFIIYAATGSKDIAEPNMTPMIDAMKKNDALFGKNMIYRVKEGGVHSFPAFQEYLFNVLPELYKPE